MTTLLLIICATLICLILLVAWALVIAARSGAGEAIEEIEQPEPECVGTICAWCHPGVDHPGGHGICPTHREEMLAQAKELSRCPATTAK